MKKVLLISALAVATMANAINPKVFQKVNVSAEKQITTEVVPFEWKDVTTILKEHDAARAPKADSVAYGLADWYYADGSFHLGIYEGLGSYNLAFTLFPLLDSVVYQNYYGPTNWTVNGKSVAENTDMYVTGYGPGGLYHLPQTADHTFNPKKDWGEGYKDTTINVKGTLYGSATNAQYVGSALESKFLKGDNVYMTLCAMETDPFNDESDFWRVSGPKTSTGQDPYYNGTGVHLDTTANTADTLGIIVDNQGVMKIEQILWPLYADNIDTVTNMIPKDAKLKVNIFPIKGKTIYLKDTLASAEMSNADFVGKAAGWGMYGTLHTKFYETDIFDQKMQVPVWIDGPFYVQLTNFNETGCNFGIFSDFDCPTTATTVYQYNGKFSYRGGKGGGGKYGQNLGVSFDAYWPTLYPANSTTMVAPVAGGDASPIDDQTNPGEVFYTNIHPVDWEVEWEDEWIEVGIDTSYYAQYGAGVVYVTAEALPTGITGRTATVEVNADGNIQTLTIIQGEGQGVENTKVNAVFENKSYDLLGREIKDDKLYKGNIIIRNGKKTLSK